MCRTVGLQLMGDQGNVAEGGERRKPVSLKTAAASAPPVTQGSASVILG